MLPASIRSTHLRIGAVICLTLACAAPFALAKVRSETWGRQTRELSAGQPLHLVKEGSRDWLAVSKAQVGVSRRVLDLLVDKANLPALATSADLGTEARAYCNALSVLEQLEPCYSTDLQRTVEPCTGYRLPLKIEQEAASRLPITGLFHAFDAWPADAPATVSGMGSTVGSYHVVRQPSPEERLAAGDDGSALDGL